MPCHERRYPVDSDEELFGSCPFKWEGARLQGQRPKIALNGIATTLLVEIGKSISALLIHNLSLYGSIAMQLTSILRLLHDVYCIYLLVIYNLYLPLINSTY